MFKFSDFKFLFFVVFCTTIFMKGCAHQKRSNYELYYGYHPDSKLSIVQLIQKYKYPVEIHEIETEDGYQLTMFRIPHGRNGNGVNRKPILLMHGLYGQAENYVIAGMNNASLAYYLADREYDVWLGNTRGTQHGRKHRSLNPIKKQFWNYSYHEIGMYDLPAKIDYILSKTKKKKLYYIGHSQGGTSFYIMNSERPEYQKKIITASLLAPAGLMGHFKNPVILPLAKAHKDLTKIAERFNFQELPPRGISLPSFLSVFCRNSRIRDFCVDIYHIILNGGDSGEFNKEMLPLMVKFIPSASSKQPLHYAQSIISGRFRKWDYGPELNYRKYGQIEPPDYKLKNITVPIAIYYSLGDNLVFPKDSEDTCRMLGNCVRKYRMGNPKWTHLDFLFSINGAKILHAPLVKFLEKFDKI